MTHADHDHWPSVPQDPHIAVLEQQVQDLQRDRDSLWHTNANLLTQVKLLETEVTLSRGLATASSDVVTAARHAARWWWSVCDAYPRLAAPWVGPLNLALRRLDQGKS